MRINYPKFIIAALLIVLIGSCQKEGEAEIDRECKGDELNMVTNSWKLNGGSSVGNCRDGRYCPRFTLALEDDGKYSLEAKLFRSQEDSLEISEVGEYVFLCIERYTTTGRRSGTVMEGKLNLVSLDDVERSMEVDRNPLYFILTLQVGFAGLEDSALFMEPN